jgi:hypothetical protein
MLLGSERYDGRRRQVSSVVCNDGSTRLEFLPQRRSWGIIVKFVAFLVIRTPERRPGLPHWIVSTRPGTALRIEESSAPVRGYGQSLYLRRYVMSSALLVRSRLASLIARLESRSGRNPVGRKTTPAASTKGMNREERLEDRRGSTPWGDRN